MLTCDLQICYLPPARLSDRRAVRLLLSIAAAYRVIHPSNACASGRSCAGSTGPTTSCLFERSLLQLVIREAHARVRSPLAVTFWNSMPNRVSPVHSMSPSPPPSPLRAARHSARRAARHSAFTGLRRFQQLPFSAVSYYVASLARYRFAHRVESMAIHGVERLCTHTLTYPPHQDCLV